MSHTNTISNHPVHIMDSQGRLSPSAFIPFCEFRGSMSIMGDVNPFLDSHVCNMFQPKIRNGQLCYQVNVNKVKDQVKDKKDWKLGLTFILDYNDERMIRVKTSRENRAASPNRLYKRKNENTEKKPEAIIYIETIGRLQ